MDAAAAGPPLLSWARLACRPSIFVHGSWLPAAAAVTTPPSTPLANRLRERLLSRHFGLPPLKRGDLQAPGASLCALSGPALGQLLQLIARAHETATGAARRDPAADDAPDTVDPFLREGLIRPLAPVSAADAAARAALRLAMIECRLCAAAAHWPAALGRRWVLRFSRSSAEHALDAGRKPRDALHGDWLLRLQQAWAATRSEAGAGSWL